MVCVKEVPADLFIHAYANHLAKKLTLPDWVDIVKTASFKEMSPYDSNWYYIRAGSLRSGTNPDSTLSGALSSVCTFGCREGESNVLSCIITVRVTRLASDGFSPTYPSSRHQRSVGCMFVASICRKLYFREDIGVGMFRKLYGGKHKWTIKAGHFRKAAGGLIRNILQQLEKMGLVEKSTEMKGGRKLTPSGQRDMDLVAGSVHFESYLDEMVIAPPEVHTAAVPVEGEEGDAEVVDE